LLTTRRETLVLRAGVAQVPAAEYGRALPADAAHSMDVRYSPFPVDPADVFRMISTKMRANAVNGSSTRVAVVDRSVVGRRVASHTDARA
jgi:hypothetical protein